MSGASSQGPAKFPSGTGCAPQAMLPLEQLLQAQQKSQVSGVKEENRSGHQTPLVQSQAGPAADLECLQPPLPHQKNGADYVCPGHLPGLL